MLKGIYKVLGFFDKELVKINNDHEVVIISVKERLKNTLQLGVL